MITRRVKLNVELGATLALALGGCLGTVGSEPGDNTAAVCQESAPTASAPLKRLSRMQLTTSLGDVLKVWAPSMSDAIVAAPAVQKALKGVRDDNRVTGVQTQHGGFRRLDQDVGQEQVDSSFAIASAVAAELTNASDRMSALLGACSTDADATNDEACVRAFITRALRTVERRAPATEDVDYYYSVYAAQGIDPLGIADVITVMLTSPYFFYQVEHGGTVIDDGKHLYALGPEELANRLSLQFWNTIPDTVLLDLVDSGRILTSDGFAEALAHVTSDPRTTKMYDEFFREFLSAEDLPEIDQYDGTAIFDAFRASFQPDGNTRENMIDEVTRLATYYASKPDGTFADLFTTKKSFATTADVAAIYGVQPWDGKSEPPDMPDAQRVGLLTHAAMLATGSPTTRPIMKGVFLRAALLCDDIPPPPANAMQVAQTVGATLSPVMSTRERTTAITSAAQCAACHAKLINPLGFLTEGFDALGRVRAAEKIFDQSGTLLGEVPVDTSSVPLVFAEDTSSATGPADLAKLIVDSKKAQICLATKYYRYSFAKLEDPMNDSCLVRTMGQHLKDGRAINFVLADIARSASFQQRVFD